MIFCCKEHVDLALDDIVDESGTAPQLEEAKFEENDDKRCAYCENEAKYMVESSE
ncbi:CxxH/CxxC protein [Bacillus tianshenii]|nr:CxxH/CxxC protein [Bacillus tianshenii]